MRSRRWAALAIGSIAAGCQQLLDLRPGSLRDGSGGTGGAECSPAASACQLAPSGWAPVALTSAACPSGFELAQPYLASVSAAAFSCSCSCGGTQVCSGTGILNTYPAGSCAGSPASSVQISFGTSCGPGGPAIEQGDGYILSNVSLAPGPACSATPIATDKPTPSEAHITVCRPTLACPGGACLSPSEQASMCVSNAGDVACPSGFPNKTVVSLGISDSRSCGSCACGSTLGCTFTSLLIDNDYACGTKNPYNFTEGANSCVAAPNSYPFNAAKANATVTGSGACAQTAASKPSGEATLDPATRMSVCCP